MPIRTVLITALLTLSVCANVTAEDQPTESFTNERLTFYETEENKVGCYPDGRAGIIESVLVEPRIEADHAVLPLLMDNHPAELQMTIEMVQLAGFNL